MKKEFNGSFDYVGEDYETIWSDSEHGGTFVNDYSMYDYNEDFASIFELLVDDADRMSTRLSSHRTLREKVECVRDITIK